MRREQTPQEYVLARIAVRESGCWEWQLHCNSSGYGQTTRRKSEFAGTGHTVLAHRFAYEAFVGPIPEGLYLDHLCRNPPCCNPQHLEPVTHTENVRRGKVVKELHCKNGHPRTPENTLIETGRRRCRVCKHEQEVKSRRKKGSLPWAEQRAAAETCPHGHPWTPENTYTYPSGARYCRECNRIAARAS